MDDDILYVELKTKGVDKTKRELKSAAGAVDDVGASVKKLGDKSQEAVPRFNKAAVAGKRMAGAATVVAGASGAAAAGILSWVTSTVAMIDEMGTLEKQSALTGERINVLRLYAEEADKSLSEVVPKELVKKLGELQRGSGEAEDAFDQLGLSADDLKGKNVDQAMDLIRVGLMKLPTEAKKSELAFRTMGTEGQNLLSTSFLVTGSLERMEGIASTIAAKTGPDASEAMSEWQQATFALSTSAEFLGNQFLWVIPILGKTTKLIASGVVVSASLAEQAFSRWAKVLSGDFSGALSDIQQDGFGLQTALKKVDEVFELLEPSAEKAGAAIDGVGDESEGASGELDGLKRSATGALRALTDINVELAGLSGNDRDQLAADVGANIERIDEQIAAYERLGSKSHESSLALQQLEQVRSALIDAAIADTIRLDAAEIESANKRDQALRSLRDQELWDKIERVAVEQEAENAAVVASMDARHLANEQQAAAAAEAESLRIEKLDGILEEVDMYGTAAGAISDMAQQVTSAIAEQYDIRTKKGRAAAKAAFAVNKAASILDIGIATIVASVNALKILPPAGPILAAIIGAQGAVSAGIVAAKQPSFHTGTLATNTPGSAPDEYGALLRSREVVLTPSAQEVMVNANAGVGASAGPAVLVLDHRAVGEVFLEQTRDAGSSVSQAMRSTRTRKLGRAY